jgi:hypothetical protein
MIDLALNLTLFFLFFLRGIKVKGESLAGAPA